MPAVHLIKLEFHGTDTDTDTDIIAEFRVRIVARMSACPATSPSSCHEPDTHDDPRRLVGHARFSSRGCQFGMRACTRVRVLYTIKLHDSRIPDVGVRVRVGVGPVEFQLKCVCVTVIFDLFTALSNA